MDKAGPRWNRLAVVLLVLIWASIVGIGPAHEIAHDERGCSLCEAAACSAVQASPPLVQSPSHIQGLERPSQPQAARQGKISVQPARAPPVV